jgi:hypothetical protein
MMSLELADFVPSQLAPELPGLVNVCAGEGVPLVAAGALSYSWSPAAGLSCTDCADPVASPAVTTTYTVAFRDGLGHEETREVTVVVNEVPSPPTITQLDDQLIATGAFGSYQWYRDGSPIPGADDNVYVPMVSGLYSVQVTTPAGCSAVSDLFSISFVGLDAAANWTASWSVSPNPFQGQLWVSLPELPAQGAYTLRAYDGRGRLVLQEQRSAGRHALPAAGWAPGIYYLRVDAHGKSQTVKLVRQ